MSSAVKRACDACHRRKVKCDGVNPCRNCSSAQLSCTYNAIPQKKGPKGSRAKVISELRENQRATSLSAKVQNRLNGINSPTEKPDFSGPNRGILAPELLKECIDFYFANMYSIIPILDRERLEQNVLYMDQNLDSHCLLTSFCAFMVLQPGFTIPTNDPLLEHPGANIAASQVLQEEAIRARKGYDYVQSPTLNCICTSYFLFACDYAIDSHNRAWLHIHEATTLMHVGNMTREEKYVRMDLVESSRWRRLYWLIFATERSYALKYDRPVSLPTSVNLPTLADDPTDPLAPQINSFLANVNLFKTFDDAFMLLWNKARSESSTPTYLESLRKQATELVHSYLSTSEGQLTDIRTNQQWLKTISWHFSVQAMRRTDEMQFPYPINVSRDLASVNAQFSTQGTEFLGVPFVAKLCEVACSLADALSLAPAGDPFGIGPPQQLSAILELVGLMRNGEHQLLPFLLHKMHDVLPRMLNPMLQRMPENFCNIDIFDGFGNAGMAQPPVMPDFKPEAFKQEPYTPGPISRMEDIAPDSSSSSGGTCHDGSSPYTVGNSPPAASSGSDYSHVNDYAMTGVVANHMGQQGQHQQNHLGQPTHMNNQEALQHHGYQAHGLPQNLGMHNPGQNNVQTHMNQPMNQQPNPGGMNQPQNTGHDPGFGHMSQDLMNGMVHRPPQQRANSFALHHPSPTSRNINEYQAMHHGGSNPVHLHGLGIGQLQHSMDFGGLR